MSDTTQFVAIALSSTSWGLIAYGIGRHVMLLNPSPATSTSLLKLTFASQLTYLAGLAASKIGICSFYLHTFQDKVSRRLARALLAFIMLYTVPLMLIVAFKCKNTSGIFTLNEPCNVQTLNIPVVYSTGTLSIMTNLFLLGYIFPRIST